MAANEIDGWEIDKSNPNRAIYTDPDTGDKYEYLVPEATPKKTEAPTPKATPRGPSRGFGERFLDSYNESGQFGGPGLVARLYQEHVGGYTKEQIAQAQRQMRKDAEKKNTADPVFREEDNILQKLGLLDSEDGSNTLERGAAYLAGQITGGADPTYAIAPGATVFERVLAQGLVAGVSDLGFQGKEILDDVRDEISAEEAVASAFLGTAFQGVMESPAFVKELFKGRGVDTTPGYDPRNSEQFRRAVEEAVQTGDRKNVEKVAQQYGADINEFENLDANLDLARQGNEARVRLKEQEEAAKGSSLEGEAQAFQGTSEAPVEPDSIFRTRERMDVEADMVPQERVIPDDGNAGKSKEDLARQLFGDEDVNAPRQEEPAVDTLFPPEEREVVVTPRQEQAVDFVNSLTGSWTNAPKIEIYDNFGQITDTGLANSLDPTAVGVTLPDGRVFINLQSVAEQAKRVGGTEADVLSAVTFHEGLGHHGLTQKFGDDLDNELVNWYDNSTDDGFAARVDEWLAENPEAYDGSSNRLARAAEEVLAEMSEDGVISPSLMEKIREFLARKGREFGLDLKYSEAEIRAIMGMAHDAVVNGKGRDVQSNDFKYMYAGPDAEQAPPIDSKKWFKGPDGKWRWEIDDSQASLDSYNLEMADRLIGEDLDTVLRHPALFKNYPELKDWTITNNPAPNDFSQSYQGWADADKKRVNITPYAKDPLSTLLHEVQHAVQSIEGFATGGMPDSALSKMPLDHLQETARNVSEYEMKKVAQDSTRLNALEALRNDPLLPDWRKASDAFQALAAERSKARDKVKHLPYKEMMNDPEYSRLVDEVTVAYNDMMKIENSFLEAQGITRESLLDDPVSRKQLDEIKGTLIYPATLDQVDTKLKKAREELDEKLKTTAELADAADSNSRILLIQNLKKNEKVTFQAYEALFGEVEARDVQKRQKLSEVERAQVEPYSMEGKVHPSEYVFDYGNSPSSEAYQSPRMIEAERKKAAAKAAENRYAKLDENWRREQELFGNEAPTNKYMRQKKGEGKESRREGGVNLDNISNVKDIDYLLSTARDRANDSSIGETVSREETTRLAQNLGLTPGKLTKTSTLNEKGLAARIDAGMQVLVNQLGKIDKLTDRLYSGSDASAASLQVQINKEMATLAAVYARVSGNNSEVGRALNILNKMRSAKGTAEDVLKYMEQHGNNVLSDPENQARFLKLLRSHQGNPAAQAKLVKAAFKPKAEDYVFRAWYNMLLSAPPTHVANALGTGANLVVDLLENTGAMAVGAVRQAFGSNADRVRGREIAYRVDGILKAIFATKDTWSKTRESLNTGMTGNQANVKAGGSSNVYTGDNKALGFTSGILEAPTRALAGADEWWRNVMELSNFYGLASRNAGNKGLKGKAFRDEVENLVNNPTKEMIDATNDYTKVLQFLDKPSAIAQGLIGVQTPKPGDSIPVRTVRGVLKLSVPFVRTPDSLIRTSLRRSPLGFIPGVAERENVKGWQAGGAERDKVIARGIMAGSLSFYFASLAAEGLITGEGPTDYKKKAEWLGSHQPNSIKVGDKWYSIQGLEPVSTNVNAIATLVEQMKSGDIKEQDYLTKAGEMTSSLVNVLINNSYMEGVLGLTEVISSDPKKAGNAFENWLAGLASSAATPAILRQKARTEDPAVRDTTGDGSFSDKVINRIKSAVPGLSEQLPQRFDVYGRRMARELAGPDMFSRTQTRMEESDPVVIEIARLAKGTDEILVGAPRKAGIKVGDTKRSLTSEEFQTYQALSGTWIVEEIRKQMEEPEWSSFSDTEKKDAIKQTVKDVRAASRDYLFQAEENEDEE